MGGRQGTWWDFGWKRSASARPFGDYLYVFILVWEQNCGLGRSRTQKAQLFCEEMEILVGVIMASVMGTPLRFIES